MDRQESAELMEALHRYFERARPDDDAYNAAISRADRERFGGQVLLMAPAAILEGLRNAVMMQTLAFRDDAAADQELQILGVHLLFCYRSLVKAYGMGGVAVLTTFGLLPSADEDVVTLIACTLGLLAGDESPMIRVSLQAAIQSLRDEIYQRYNTACKVALAWALLRMGISEPFKAYAVPALLLVTFESRQNLERLASSRRQRDQLYLDSLVLKAVILDIASAGRALPRWQRRVKE